MNRQVPTLGKLLTMAFFALSVFGLTLFMWISFGGPIPFKAQGYRIKTSFPEATQLAVEADVRMAGVPIGRVKEVVPGADGRAAVVLEVQKRFAPLPKGTKAILSQKTLLGETYVSLTPPHGKLTGEPIPEGGRIPISDVGDTTELDELFQTFDEETRELFQQWMADSAVAFKGQGQNAGRTFVELQLFVGRLAGLTKTLADQSPALESMLRDGKTALNASTSQSGALREAFVQSERVFRQLGDQDAALTAFVEKLPPFLTKTRTGTRAIESFARDTRGTATRLRPTVRALKPAFVSLRDVSPELRTLLEGIERVNDNARRGLPATQRALGALPTLLEGLDSFLRQLNPVLEYASVFSPDLMATLGNVTATLQGAPDVRTVQTYRDGRPMRAARGATMITPEGLTTASSRLSTNRANAYRKPGWAADLLAGLQTYGNVSCGTVTPSIPDTTNPTLNAPESLRARQGFPAPSPDLSLIDAIRYSLFNPQGAFLETLESTTPSEYPAPTTPKQTMGCVPQPPFNLGGRLTTYPQLPAAPSSTAPSVNFGG